MNNYGAIDILAKKMVGRDYDLANGTEDFTELFIDNDYTKLIKTPEDAALLEELKATWSVGDVDNSGPVGGIAQQLINRMDS